LCKRNVWSSLLAASLRATCSRSLELWVRIVGDLDVVLAKGSLNLCD